MQAAGTMEEPGTVVDPNNAEDATGDATKSSEEKRGGLICN